MAFINWIDERYSLKVEQVDAQHKHLVALVNRMHEAVVQGSERGVLGQILDELIDYTVYHFRTEEEFFARHHYPELEAHKRQHNALTEQVLKLQAEFEAGSATISYEVLDFIHDWLVNHMANSDRKFLYYMESQNRPIS
jgi:hemerythrin